MVSNLNFEKKTLFLVTIPIVFAIYNVWGCYLVMIRKPNSIAQNILIDNNAGFCFLFFALSLSSHFRLTFAL